MICRALFERDKRSGCPGHQSRNGGRMAKTGGYCPASAKADDLRAISVAGLFISEQIAGACLRLTPRGHGTTAVRTLLLEINRHRALITVCPPVTQSGRDCLYAARVTVGAKVACVIDTIVPSGPAKVSTLALRSCARALIMPVPSPVFVWAKTPSGLPIPLSATDSFQFVPSTSYATLIRPFVFWSGNACLRAFMTSSVAIKPMLSA